MAYWLLPANPKYYDINSAFETLVDLDWYQTNPLNKIQVNDIAYIYQGRPIQKISWMCRVTAVNKPRVTISDSAFHIPPLDYDNLGEEGRWIELHAICQFPDHKLFSFENLKKHGMPFAPQGPQHAKDEFVDYIESIVEIPDEEEMLEGIYDDGSDRSARKTTTTSTAFVRDPVIKERTLARANGRCQLCGRPAPFKDKDGKPYLEVHHIIWLSRGGKDALSNTAALCPNCHRKMHRLDLESDVTVLKNAVSKH